MKTLDKEAQKKLTPAEAIQLLKDGNMRFVNNLKLNRNLLEQVNETSEGQYPFAIILSCIDSRTSAELIFDQGLGDIFSVRIAGNILNDDILGSIEFACKVSGSKLIAVLGHTKCGAINGACNNVKLGHLTTLLDKIKPAIHIAKDINHHGEADVTSAEFIHEVTDINVDLVIHEIVSKSDIIRDLLTENKIAMIGGTYDAETGVVDFKKTIMSPQDL